MPGPDTPFVLDHVAIGVPRVGDAMPFAVGELGGTEYGAGPGLEFLWWQYRFDGGGVLELLEPDATPGGFLQRFLDRRGAGVHHVTFKVPDIHAAMRRAGDAGYQVVGFSEAFPGWKEAFLHPKQAQGIVVQLAEAGPEDEEAHYTGRYPFPEAPPDPPPPVRLVGVRLAARSAERARAQWEGLLCGGCVERGASLEFRWPESALRIRVDVDPSAEEGPRALEIASDRPVRLPEGPHPVLGIPFAVVDPDAA